MTQSSAFNSFPRRIFQVIRERAGTFSGMVWEACLSRVQALFGTKRVIFTKIKFTSFLGNIYFLGSTFKRLPNDFLFCLESSNSGPFLRWKMPVFLASSFELIWIPIYMGRRTSTKDYTRKRLKFGGQYKNLTTQVLWRTRQKVYKINCCPMLLLLLISFCFHT